MSVLERYLNTEKYQGVMRELAIAQILNEKAKPGLFIKANALDRCGWVGEESEADPDLTKPRNLPARLVRDLDSEPEKRGWAASSLVSGAPC